MKGLTEISGTQKQEQLSEMPAGDGVIYKAKPVPAAGAELILGAGPAHPGSWPLSLALFSAKLTLSLPENCSGLKPEWKLWGGAGDST